MTSCRSTGARVPVLRGGNVEQNQATISTIGNREYSDAQQFLKPIKRFHAEKGTYYEIEGIQFKDRIFFRAVQTGWVTIKYRCIEGKDCFAFAGKGKLSVMTGLTEGMEQ